VVTRDYDYVLAGGGLANGLIALAVRAHQPAARIAMIERGAEPGGNHTWCFHAGDTRAEMAAWLEPLIDVRWDGYDVAFPALRRRLASPYACVTSRRLATAVRAALAHDGSALYTRATATAVEAERVVVRAADGGELALHGRAVIDARGPDRAEIGRAGWQKFVGRELVLAAPHGLARPTLIDATVEQRDGFRFVYVLPLATDRVLVEDTYFADGTFLDVAAARAGIADYVDARGWRVAEVVREETGVLALPWRCAPPAPHAPLVAGYAGGWFHPVTGYSFPIAARLAAFVAARPASELFGPALAEHAHEHARQLPFAARLNRMMFGWFAPAQRYRLLERFYRLPEVVIRRFYSLELTARDRARIVVGKPPRGLSLAAMLGRSQA